MTLAELKEQLTGDWAGTKLLRLEPGVPDRITPSNLTVSTVAGGRFLSLAYTWSFDGKPQEGFMMVGYDKNDGLTTIGWGDSFHQNSKVMLSEGVIHPDGEIDVKGYYGMPGQTPWGWRTTIKATPTGLLLEMYNCEPDAAEELAVRGDYTRRGGSIA
jgi:hypothetical protein